MAEDLSSPFCKIDGLDRNDFREAAYEVFFTACRSSPGFGGRNAIPYYKSSGDGGGDGMAPEPESPAAGGAVISRIKRELGLKMLNRPRRSSSIGSSSSSPASMASPGSSPTVGFTVPAPRGRVRRPMTSAEIMKEQMRITDQSDNRLRKTLMRTLVGQMGRRAETIILPLELLRHLKPSEFSNGHDYHIWQQRQLKILEAGLLHHPAIPLEKSNTFATNLRDIIDSSEAKTIDTGRNSDTMRALCNCVLALAWRSPNPSPDNNEICHWADGYPLNVHIYTALLRSLFDLTDETSLLDEVDELLELTKKTWSVLGIDRSIHNLCFAWVIFEQYVMTGQVEPDLLGACLIMFKEVEADARRVRGKEEMAYLKMLQCILPGMAKWCRKKLLDYHENFRGDLVRVMEAILPLLCSCTKILEENVSSHGHKVEGDGEFHGNKIDYCIRSSMKNAFVRMVEDRTRASVGNSEAQEPSKKLIKWAKKTEELAAKEKENFSPLLKKWNPTATGVASVALHTCYGCLLKQYLAGKSSPLHETLLVLQRAGKLEQALMQMVVEDSVECEDGGKSIVRQMIPYEVDTVIERLLKQWIQERLQMGKEHVLRAKQTESWNPTSKTQPYAQSAKDLIGFAKETMEKFLEIPINLPENIFYDLVDGIDNVFSDYISFVASCGAKQSYLPTLPPLTRCCHDSKLFKLWKKTACGVGLEDPFRCLSNDGKNPNLWTSRGTQRLYIRINTLSYLDAQLHSLEKSLTSASSSKVTQSKNHLGSSRRPSEIPYFDQTYSATQVASHHVCEVAAYRLIFLDSYVVFYGSLYVRNVAKARITLALRILEQNITLLRTIVAQQVQALALKEVMRASFEAFLRVLLAGGNSRVFSQLDHPMIEEDLESLKRVFYAHGECMLPKDMVDKEAEAANGVVAVMKESTEQLVENFKSAATEACGIGVVSSKPRITMPPTTGKWNRSDPNTILRVLCNRNDRIANRFLKKTFHLPKRRYANKMS
ncbi:protein unc-13 homolog [Andrographis paniculata]|uniref:protein unc-13 homolog n=1 Tax=Andrographis paniculata TaxID=175694 RepID=UPI0021E7B108|nr:protein unc-13 homolog [Andrographis paniculata]